MLVTPPSPTEIMYVGTGYALSVSTCIKSNLKEIFSLTQSRNTDDSTYCTQPFIVLNFGIPNLFWHLWYENRPPILLKMPLNVLKNLVEPTCNWVASEQFPLNTEHVEAVTVVKAGKVHGSVNISLVSNVKFATTNITLSKLEQKGIDGYLIKKNWRWSNTAAIFHDWNAFPHLCCSSGAYFGRLTQPPNVL